MTLTSLPIATACSTSRRHHVHTRTVSSPADRRHRRGAIHHRRRRRDHPRHWSLRLRHRFALRPHRDPYPRGALRTIRGAGDSPGNRPNRPSEGPATSPSAASRPTSKKLLAGSMASTAALGAIGFAALLPIGTFWQALIIVAAVITIASSASSGSTSRRSPESRSAHSHRVLRAAPRHRPRRRPRRPAPSCSRA